MLLPALSKAKERARFTRWLGFAAQMQRDDDLVAQYLFQQPEEEQLINTAYGTGIDGYRQEDLHLTGYMRGGGAYAPGLRHKQCSRWPGSKGCATTIDQAYYRVDAPNRHLNPGQYGLTVFAWLKWDSYTGHDFLGHQGNTGSGNPGWSLWAHPTDGGINARTCDNSIDKAAQKLGSTPDLNRWHLVAMVIDRETDQVFGYLADQEVAWANGGGGAPAATLTLASTIEAASSELFTIGSTASGGTTGDWVIDEFAIIRRALTAQDIQDIYTMGNP
jgi:hypothetical protein